jgi:hypothetical protein
VSTPYVSALHPAIIDDVDVIARPPTFVPSLAEAILRIDAAGRKS